jgi:hypothetical protein
MTILIDMLAAAVVAGGSFAFGAFLHTLKRTGR